MTKLVPSRWLPRAAWRHLGRAGRRDVLQLARQGRQHPDEATAVVAVQWARWRLGLPLWWQFVLAVAAVLGVQAVFGLIFLVLVLLARLGFGEVTHRGGWWPWVQVAGWFALAVVRLVVIPSSDAHDILRMHAPAAESGMVGESR
jgi:hypothetical protein